MKNCQFPSCTSILNYLNTSNFCSLHNRILEQNHIEARVSRKGVRWFKYPYDNQSDYARKVNISVSDIAKLGEVINPDDYFSENRIMGEIGHRTRRIER